MAKKEAAQKNIQKPQRKKSSVGFALRILLVFIVILSAVYLPTAVFLFVGLLPSIVAFFVDSSRKKRKCVTVGAINLAGCMPFLLDIWFTDHSFSKAVSLLTEPTTIVMIYAAAGFGYVLDWFLTIVVSGYVYQRGSARIKVIQNYQQDLIKRWGVEVSNTVPLDSEGFPIEKEFRT